jgi:hypothetical protein
MNSDSQLQSGAAVSSSELVRCWWKVAHRDGYEIGSECKSWESAEYYLTKCVDKKRRNQCKVVRYELHKIEAPNSILCRTANEID